MDGLWECTSGSVRRGERTIIAVIREIEEELGIKFKENEAKFLGTIREKDYFRDVWLFKRNVLNEEIKFNDGEVVETKWVTLEKYKELLNKGIIVPNGRYVTDLIERNLEVER